MGKIALLASVMFIFGLHAETTVQKEVEKKKESSFDRNCMICHKQMSLTMQKIFMRYLLKYSSEVSVKSAMIDFLKNPNYFTSALRKDQIARYGLKSRSNLSDKELKDAIDVYWEKYKVFGKLK
jgi:hypothetical protein